MILNEIYRGRFQPKEEEDKLTFVFFKLQSNNKFGECSSMFVTLPRRSLILRLCHCTGMSSKSVISRLRCARHWVSWYCFNSGAAHFKPILFTLPFTFPLLPRWDTTSQNLWCAWRQNQGSHKGHCVDCCHNPINMTDTLPSFCKGDKQALLAFALGMSLDQNLQREKHCPETLSWAELLCQADFQQSFQIILIYQSFYWGRWLPIISLLAIRTRAPVIQIHVS